MKTTPLLEFAPSKLGWCPWYSTDHVKGKCPTRVSCEVHGGHSSCTKHTWKRCHPHMQYAHTSMASYLCAIYYARIFTMCMRMCTCTTADVHANREIPNDWLLAVYEATVTPYWVPLHCM